MPAGCQQEGAQLVPKRVPLEGQWHLVCACTLSRGRASVCRGPTILYILPWTCVAGATPSCGAHTPSLPPIPKLARSIKPFACARSPGSSLAPARLAPSMLAALMQGGSAVMPWVAFYGLVYGTAWVLGPLLLPHHRMVKMLYLHCPSSAPVPPQSLAALGSLPLPGRGRPTGRPATASGARASRLQSRRSYRL